MDTRSFQNSNFSSVKYSDDYEKLKNKMRNEYRKTIHDMIVINRFMKTDDKTTKKLEGLLQVLDGKHRITYNGLLQVERYIAQIHKRIRNESIKGQEENTILLKHQKEKIDNLEETKIKLEKEKEVLEDKLKHSGSCPICWNPYDCDKNGGVSKKFTLNALSFGTLPFKIVRFILNGRVLKSKALCYIGYVSNHVFWN